MAAVTAAIAAYLEEEERARVAALPPAETSSPSQHVAGIWALADYENTIRKGNEEGES